MSLVLAACSHLSGLAAPAESSEVTVGEWVGFTAGVLVGLLGMAVAVGIAVWQRFIQVRDRAEERAEQRRSRDAELERQDRLARRDLWRAEYDEIRTLLTLGEDVVYQVRHHGPLTADGLRGTRLDTFTMRAEQLASRGVESLQGSLLKLASFGDQVYQYAVPEDHEVEVAYGGAPTNLPDRLRPHALQRLAVLQERAARDLADEIRPTWDLLRKEWGA